jgi:peptidoglycan/LPS O-acetylase OafA/YrhL
VVGLVDALFSKIVRKVLHPIHDFIKASIMSKPQDSPDRYASLQSLRGIAALIVLFRHVDLCFPASNGSLSFAIFLNSHAAVVIFFVLSGFVLSQSMENLPKSAVAILYFYLRRLFRILPLLFLVTLACIFYTQTDIASVEPDGLSPFFKGMLTHEPIRMTNALLSFFALSSHYVPQNWTIWVELAVGIAFPILYWFSLQGLAANLPLLSSLVAASALSSSRGFMLPINYMFCFQLGVMSYLYRDKLRLQNPRLLLLAASLAIISLMGFRTLFGIFAAPAPFHSTVVSFAEGIASCFLILFIVKPGPLSDVLRHRILSFIGDISYGVYLTHFLIIALLGRLLDRQLASLSEDIFLPRGLVFGTLVASASLLVSYPLFRYIELPANNLGRHLANRLKLSVHPVPLP